MLVHQRILKSLSLSVCLILSLSVNHASADNAKCVKEAGAIENFTLQDYPKPMSKETFVNLKGEAASLTDFKGKAVLLNHWAMWCGPCIREMPSILRLSEKLTDKNVAVIPLSMDRPGYKKVARFVEKKKWAGGNFYNDQKMKVSRASSVTGIPATQILNKDGLEIGRLVGTYEWDAPEVVALLNCLAN